MKLKVGFIFIIILILFISTSTVYAADNSVSEEWNLTLSLETECEKAPEGTTTSEGTNYTWTVTVTNTAEVPRNISVYTDFTDNIKYISHAADTGFYNLTSKIWIIENLTPNKPQSIIINATIIQKNQSIFTAVAICPSAPSNITSMPPIVNYDTASGSSYKVKEDATKPPAYSHVEIYMPNEYSEYRTVTKRVNNEKANAGTQKTPTDNKPDTSNNNNQNNNKNTNPISSIISKTINFLMSGNSGNSKGENSNSTNTNITENNTIINLNDEKTSNPVLLLLLMLFTIITVNNNKKEQ